ncbi:ribonuclease HI family protein [bacterium]|nr:MAG: ribonuclease HI family protein [bacterium]
MTLHAFTDGASRGNPGESGIGIIVRDGNNEVLFSLNGYIGNTTNNVAEYRALLALLQRIASVPCTHLVVHSDSELMVRQVNGQYKVKDRELRKYYQQVLAAISSLPFRVELKHIPREENRDADKLANLGIDTRTEISFQAPEEIRPQ